MRHDFATKMSQKFHIILQFIEINIKKRPPFLDGRPTSVRSGTAMPCSGY